MINLLVPQRNQRIKNRDGAPIHKGVRPLIGQRALSVESEARGGPQEEPVNSVILDAPAPDGNNISVVVQGPLGTGNCVEVGYYVAHWRAMLPRAQIILAISDNHFEIGTSGQLLPPTRDNGNTAVTVSISAINAACDIIVIAPAAVALPPLKFDSKANNLNFQISAAKAGLAQATRKYCLRIRNDIILYSNGFLEHYREFVRLPRGAFSFLEQRILICDTYTLNPYTIERCPYHYSDWFHFGLISDVRVLWQSGPMPFLDAIFHEFHRHRPHSSRQERQFRARLACEQYLTMGWLLHYCPEARLDYLNDLEQRDRSMAVLRDNFIIADRKVCGLRFVKYADVRSGLRHRLLCLDHADWRVLASDPSRGRFAHLFVWRVAVAFVAQLAAGLGLLRSARWVMKLFS